MSGQGWTEMSLPQAGTLALDTYGLWQSQHPQVQPFSLPTLGKGNCQLQSHPLKSGIDKVSGEPGYPYEFNNNNNKEK